MAAKKSLVSKPTPKTSTTKSSTTARAPVSDYERRKKEAKMQKKELKNERKHIKNLEREQEIRDRESKRKVREANGGTGLKVVFFEKAWPRRK